MLIVFLDLFPRFKKKNDRVEQDRQTFANNYTSALAIVAARPDSASRVAFSWKRPATFYLAMFFEKDAFAIDHSESRRRRTFFQACDISEIINVDYVIAGKRTRLVEQKWRKD